METIGARLGDTRRRRVMTQAELATRAGMSVVTVNRLENSGPDASPRPDTIRRLAKVLKVDPAWLLFGEDDVNRAA